MFLRSTIRKKDGKAHRYWSVVENRRVFSGKVVQKSLLYLGEINDSQESRWSRAIDVVEGEGKKQFKLFPSDKQIPEDAGDVIQVRMHELRLKRPRQWGACWLGCELWKQLELDEFWVSRLRKSRKGTDWLQVLKLLTIYRLIAPGSEWRLHRLWFDQTAMADLLGCDFSIAQKDKLYRCTDLVVEHKDELFKYLQLKWKTLFEAKFEVLLYDLTSTYFESEPAGVGKRQFGYSRDKRSDCVQVVIALIVTTEGLPLAYEVLPGNTRDSTTLRAVLQKIQGMYGQAQRIWVMDRGIPTEEVLMEMQKDDSSIQYIVGTPKGRLTKLEKGFMSQPWQKVRESVEVKLLPEAGEVYVLVKSQKRIFKEMAIRRGRLKKLLARLNEIKSIKKLSRDALLKKIGAAEKDAGRFAAAITIQVDKEKATFTYSLNRQKLKEFIRKEGHYLLRSNIVGADPCDLWTKYIQLTEVEEAFKSLKGDLSIRPIYHQRDDRIESHIFIAFLSYCLHATLKMRSKVLAKGLTPRSIIEQLKAIQMLDVEVPTSDNKRLVMSRYTQPDKTQALILQQLKLLLPEQPPPKIYPVVKT